MSADRFHDWLSVAKKGDQFVYARCVPHMRAGCLPETARAVSEAEMSGHVCLVQKRVRRPASKADTGAFDYIAIRTVLDTV